MAQTMQLISKTQYATSSAISAYAQQEPEDNISLMLSACNSLNHLCILLERLDHVVKMKNIELKNKLNEKENASPLAEPSKFTSPLEPKVRKRLKKE